jgi:hypothetical protein
MKRSHEEIESTDRPETGPSKSAKTSATSPRSAENVAALELTKLRFSIYSGKLDDFGRHAWARLTKWIRWWNDENLRVSTEYASERFTALATHFLFVEIEQSLESEVFPLQKVEGLTRWLEAEVRRECVLHELVPKIEEIESIVESGDPELECIWRGITERFKADGICTYNADKGVLELDASFSDTIEDIGTFGTTRNAILDAHRDIKMMNKRIKNANILVLLVREAIAFGGEGAKRRLLKVVNRDSLKNTKSERKLERPSKWPRKRYTSVEDINFIKMSDFDIANVKAMCKRFEKNKAAQQQAEDAAALKNDGVFRSKKAAQMAANNGRYTHEGEDGTAWYVKDGCDNDSTDEFTRDQPLDWIEV